MIADGSTPVCFAASAMAAWRISSGTAPVSDPLAGDGSGTWRLAGTRDGAPALAGGFADADPPGAPGPAVQAARVTATTAATGRAEGSRGESTKGLAQGQHDHPDARGPGRGSPARHRFPFRACPRGR